MGAMATKDAFSSLSPWNTQVVLSNQCNTPVLVFLAHDHTNPRPENAHEIEVPPSADFPVNSGWFKEPRATLLVRTGLHEAKVIRAANHCRITISLMQHGLKLETTDDVSIEDFACAGEVRGLDTVPMFVHGNHFADVRPEHLTHGHSHPLEHVVHDVLATVSPWTTQVLVDNQCNTPVLLHLADHKENPTPEEAQEFTVPANQRVGINSGWLREPKATLLIRTGVHEAKILRAEDKARIVVSLLPHGLGVTSLDHIEIEDFPDPSAVRGLDTVPMAIRGEHFTDAGPKAHGHDEEGACHSAASGGA